MPRVALLFCATFATVISSRGGSIDNAIVAAMKLPEARNYCWVATVQDDSRFYTVEGRTEKGGYTLVNMPMISSIRRKLGADVSELHTAIFKGDAECVISTPDGWKTPGELNDIPTSPLVPSAERKGRWHLHGTLSANSGVGAIPGTPGFRYSNLQLNLSHPHDEVGIIIGSYLNLHPETDGLSGTLSEEGARLLLVHPGQDEITPLRASGTFQLWIKDGVLVKYEVRLAGTISVGTGPSRWEISVHQTVTTELKAIGTTAFEVPEEAKLKLG